MREATALPGRRNVTAPTPPRDSAAALGRAEPIAREPREEPLELGDVGGGQDHERRRPRVVARAGGVEEREGGAAARIDARLRERLRIERVEPELRRERPARAREAARARERRDRRVERRELGGRPARLRDDHHGADGGGDEPLGRRAAPTTFTRDQRDRRDDEGAAERAPEHVLSLPW